MTPDPLALPAFVISILSLVLAVVGAATGIVSLTWQIITRTRGAHRIVVVVNSKMFFIGAGAPGDDHPYIAVVIRNTGAAPVEIDSWAIRLPDGNALVTLPAQFPPSPDLPYMLIAGSSVTFFTLSSSIAEAAAGRDLARSWAVAHLATGQVARSKKGISV